MRMMYSTATAGNLSSFKQAETGASPMSMDSKGHNLMESFLVGKGDDNMYLTTDVTMNPL